MKIWLDDLRSAPDGFVWCRSVNQAKRTIEEAEKYASVEIIDCDHDLGDYAHDKRARIGMGKSEPLVLLKKCFPKWYNRGIKRRYHYVG